MGSHRITSLIIFFLASSALLSMSHSSYLDGLWDVGIVAIKLLFCGVLLPGFVQNSIHNIIMVDHYKLMGSEVTCLLFRTCKNLHHLLVNVIILYHVMFELFNQFLCKLILIMCPWFQQYVSLNCFILIYIFFFFSVEQNETPVPKPADDMVQKFVIPKCLRVRFKFFLFSSRGTASTLPQIFHLHAKAIILWICRGRSFCRIISPVGALEYTDCKSAEG